MHRYIPVLAKNAGFANRRKSGTAPLENMEKLNLEWNVSLMVFLI
jgi:hypothetical protein